jgi:predicted O-methyltransferase YrrM
MRTFTRHFIVPLALRRKWKSICEIGASMGGSADELLKLQLDSYTIIDPCFDQDLQAKYAADTRVNVLKCNSLDALTSSRMLLPGRLFDVILIDGDHNWYTVFNELRLIHEHELLRPGGYIFLHDVDWPYGRRDMYYQPDTIPANFRQPFAQQGMVRGRRYLSESDGVNREFMNALEEGGLRNGVLTAVEDFVAKHPRNYRFCWVRFEFGLGILQSRTQQRFSALSFYRQWTKALAWRLFGRQAAALKAALTRYSAS